MTTTVAGRYQLVREIGAGGMGRVFQALDTETGRTVAAKILIAGDQVGLQALLRFQTEGAVLSTLRHPNIVQVYSTHLEEHISCIIMELLDGRSLAQILRSEQLSLARTKHVMQQVAAALAFAHSRGIVHRDVKPDNIMVVGNDRVKVTDFGIARVLQEGNTLSALTSTGVSVGTPLYMSPEQIEGQKVDGRTDIYSFGVVLYQMVTGRPPFEGDDPLTVAFKHVHKPPPPPGRLNPELPEDWERLILTCLAKNPAGRVQTAAALEAGVSSLEVGAGVGNRLPTTLQLPDPPALEEAGTRALDQETRTLLEEGRTKEQRGELQEALRDYRVALTVASPGPLRDELEAAITRILETPGRPPAYPPPRSSAPLRDRRVQIGSIAIIITLVLASFLVIRHNQAIDRANADATATAVAASATATVTALVASARSYPRTVYGPAKGTLRDPGRGVIALSRASRGVRNFAALIRFHNPSDGENWDYGLAFRETGTDKQYRLVVTSDNKWYLVYGVQRSETSGAASSLRTAPGQSNDLLAIVTGHTLRLFVNGSYVSDIRVSKVETGTVRAALDVYRVDSLPGRAVRYDKFTVWSSPPAGGPMFGALHHRIDISAVIFAAAGVHLRNFVAEARFLNPYASVDHSWDYGFMFREIGRDHQYRMAVTSDGRWHLAYGPGPDLAHGSVIGLRTGNHEANDLRLVVKGKTAVLFVNGRYAAAADVSSKMGSGNVDVVTGVYAGNELQGKATQYKNFVVWSLDG